ncbi:c-type cytochrome [Roseateles chitinivorans]|uniref:c-type cytochrome n=1 Tax=Roseateles chitinivorans TaxID=2917965 RepID=UPI003D67DDFF
MTEPPRRLSPVKALLAAGAAAGVIGAAGAAAFVWFGVYDVSATGPHLQPVHSLLEIALQRAVQRRADAHPPPPDLLTRDRVMQGAACFRDRCVACHGAPGVAPQAFALGMQPVPSSLVEATRHWRPQDLYWITRNGIKMSGMPAWEYRLEEGELWGIVAFLDALPLMTPDQYRVLTASTEKSPVEVGKTGGATTEGGSAPRPRRRRHDATVSSTRPRRWYRRCRPSSSPSARSASTAARPATRSPAWSGRTRPTVRA